MKKFDKFLFVDFELTCDAQPIPNPEIIEVGFCFLDLKTKQISTPESYFIKPTGKLSEYCISLTGITPDDVRKGMPWDQAKRYLTKKGTRQYAWGAFGRDNEHVGDNSPFSDVFYNLGILIPLLMGCTGKVGMYDLLKQLNVEQIGGKHQAGTDACNLARLASKTLFR